MDISSTQSATQGQEDATCIRFTLWPSDNQELKDIIGHHMLEWAELYARKNAEYGDGNSGALGERGQFSDMYRKMIKLKRAMWDADESVLTTEGVDEILMDLIGHAFMTLRMRAINRIYGEKEESGEASDIDAMVNRVVSSPVPESVVNSSGLTVGVGGWYRFRQHLGKGRAYKVVSVAPASLPDDNMTVLVHVEGGLEEDSWTNPDFLEGA